MLGAQTFGVKPVELTKFLIVAEALVEQKNAHISSNIYRLTEQCTVTFSGAATDILWRFPLLPM